MKRLSLPLSMATSVWMAVAAGAQTADPKSAILQGIEAKRAQYGEVALKIWSFAEVGFQEERSSALLAEQLAAAGFAVRKGVADVPTAFVASYGTGRPVIAIVGEFDALPGLSQDAAPERRPVAGREAGHGCGHNLFGTASLAAAVAVKDWLASSKRTGTVRYYGTPAEEGGSGKVYMLRAGLFADVDVVVGWHPGDRNEASPSSTLANVSAKFRFHGLSAHAAAAPEKGRSALDGVEAMNYMVNLMREHVPQETRIHYVITRGGAAPNVVPDFAEVFYYARHPDSRVLDGIWERIVKASEGAALGTGTRVEHEVIGAVHSVLPNATLSALQQANLERVGGVRYSPEEQSFAATLSRNLPPGGLALGSQEQVQPSEAKVTSASTDMGDVSWNVPTVQMTAATWVPGTPAHSWQAVACSGTSIGVQGMMVAAKTMALTAVDLLSDPAHLAAARAEFERRREGFVYKPRIGDRPPALDYRKD